MVELPRYQRILNPTDGSQASLRASVHAIYLAQRLQAHLDVLAVAEVDYHLGIHLSEELVELEQEGHAALDQVEQMAREHGVSVAKLLVRGEPGPAILSVAAERQSDLIVLGAHRMGALERVLLGSTSQHVSQHASLPVLIVREQPKS
ncbi:MAG: universal stress protein [Chloroflexi bacterium]|nr:universal stress protein [Chloroflexota bacterium]